MAIVTQKQIEAEDFRPEDKVNSIEIPINVFDGFKCGTKVVKLACDKAPADYAKLLVKLKSDTKTVASSAMCVDGSINILLKNGICVNLAPIGKCNIGISDVVPPRPEMELSLIKNYFDDTLAFWQQHFVGEVG